MEMSEAGKTELRGGRDGKENAGTTGIGLSVRAVLSR